MSSFMTTIRNLAKLVDYSTATRLPLNTDGARPELHGAEKKVIQAEELLTKPVGRPSDLPAYWDAIANANGVGIDDRKMLLEKLLVAMSRLKDHPISLKIQQQVIGLLYKDLPHPPEGFLSPLETGNRYGSTDPHMPRHVNYAYRAADGSNYNPLAPGLGRAGSPYARSVPSTSITPKSTLPDPYLLFDTLLKRDEFTPHPDGISSLFFAFADLVIHSIFKTNRDDWNINDTSSYLDLNILYGNSQEELDTIKRFDGTGKLYDDCFADSRLLMMPPASCALLVLLNRNHNYIAQKLLEINEYGRYRDPATLSDAQRRVQDDELFHRTRLVNCGYFMHIILGDYVGAILGLVRDGSDWRLDPLQSTRELDHDLTPRGEGNVVSIEFNLLYRWHSAVSTKDEQWLEKIFNRMFTKVPPEQATVSDFKELARMAIDSRGDAPPTQWTFGGLKRVDGKFKDAELAEIVQDATFEVAGAFKARGVPACMRVIEVMTILQARSWGTCSLNEFRKFIGLKPYSTFEEWNPDPRVHVPAAALYKDIDKLELHVGLQAEETKAPQPGAGLCPGYTISRAILADAVCLTRGDRFLTTDFTPFNLTAWGYQDCQYDKEDGSYGGLLTKLLFRTLPDYYPAGSGLAHFPFNTPEAMQKNLKDGSLEKYHWPKRDMKFVTKDWRVVEDYKSVKQILTTSNSNFISSVPTRLENVVNPILDRSLKINGQRAEDDRSAMHNTIRQQQTTVMELIAETPWDDYFRNKTSALVQYKSFDKVGSNVNCIDIVKDVINLLPIYWICDEIAGLPLKSKWNPRGAWYEQDVYNQFADIARYVYNNFDPIEDFKLRERSQKTAIEVVDWIRQYLDGADSRFGSIMGSIRSKKSSKNDTFLKRLRNRLGRDVSSQECAISLFNAVVPTAAIFSKAIAHVVDYFLDDANKEAREQFVKLFDLNTAEASTELLGYVQEALRLNPIFAGVYRTAGDTTVLADHQRTDVNDWAFVSILKANESLGTTPDYARSADKRGILTPYEDGMMSPKFFESVAPVVIGTILKLQGLGRANGESGKLTHFYEDWHETRRKRYVNTQGLVTPWPDAMIVQYVV